MTDYTDYIYKLIVKKSSLGLLLLAILAFASSYGQDHTEIQLANEYLLKGDKKKALELYRSLSKEPSNIPLIHNNYLNLMLDLAAYDEAHDYLKRILRRDPQNVHLKLDVGLIYVRSGDLSKSDRYFRQIIADFRMNHQMAKMIADYLAARSLIDYAILMLTECREYHSSPYLFCLDLAMLYRIQGRHDKMVEEYLTYVTQNSANIQYVKNIMQALLTKPEELESLERLLYDKVQKNPDVEVYSDLLIWVTMQQKNFNASFIQARAYDRRYKKSGEKCLEVARVALDNGDFDVALKIYRYVVREYPGTPNHLLARLGLIRTREAKVKKSYPVNRDSVLTLIDDYNNFIAQYQRNAHAYEALRNKALLYATYLDQKDSAIHILNKLISSPGATVSLKAKAKLDLGDIYLINGEPWESTLLYSQVEKSQRESPLGYEAKLRNAKLSYFKGDFLLAQEHLDILKQATTREIANDAMELSMRIKENLAFDTVGEALRQFAAVELLLYQNKQDQALEKLEWLKQGKVISGESNTDVINFSNRTILDDVYWLEADIRMKRGEFVQAIALLQKILDEYPDDVLGDDAYFLQGDIYDKHLQDKSKAMEIYRDFLNRFPGSVYAAEARKRYRVLRGDFNESPVN